jgi:hypothetical protein
MNAPLTKTAHKKLCAYLKEENARYPLTLQLVPRHEWPPLRPGASAHEPERSALWRSRDFLVQVFEGTKGVVRLSISRTMIDINGLALDGITWDDLQRLKSEAGFGNSDAVEIYPHDSDVINVANMRHLWIIPGRLSFAWRAKHMTEPETIESEVL